MSRTYSKISALSIIFAANNFACGFHVGQKNALSTLRPFRHTNHNDHCNNDDNRSDLSVHSFTYDVRNRGSSPLNVMSRRRLSTDFDYFMHRDADFGEILAGGTRYEMVELPDSMVDTTIFVGNLCEFVTDDMLSTLFQQVSTLNFVPACVARKPNMSSLKYGFVTFPTVSEKEAAILKFTGYELNNKKIRVEEIQDHEFRVRVPEKLVVYAVGELKRTREGKKNTMRKVSNSRESDPGMTGSSSSSAMNMSSSSRMVGRKNYKNKRRNRKKLQSSSPSMLGSDVVRRGGYKNMKRREKRKQRRTKSNTWDDYYGLR